MPNPSVCLINGVCTWRSPAAPTGARSAGALSSGSGCRTSSCPGSESGWQRHACSLAQLGPENNNDTRIKPADTSAPSIIPIFVGSDDTDVGSCVIFSDQLCFHCLFEPEVDFASVDILNFLSLID